MTSSELGWNADKYDREFSFVATYGKDLLSLLQPKAEEHILDIGCGTGQLTDLISKSVSKIVGLDNSAEMVEAASKKFPDLEFILADAAYFDLGIRFDAIFSNAALHWVLDYQSCIERMYKHLKPGGRLVLEMGGKGNINNILIPLRTVLHKYGYQAQSNLNLWYFPSIGEYSSALESEGFRVTMAHHFDRPTELKGDITVWLDMFAGEFLKDISTKEREQIKNEVQEIAKNSCYTKGRWYADYKRLRIIAIKEE